MQFPGAPPAERPWCLRSRCGEHRVSTGRYAEEEPKKDHGSRARQKRTRRHRHEKDARDGQGADPFGSSQAGRLREPFPYTDDHEQQEDEDSSTHDSPVNDGTEVVAVDGGAAGAARP